MNHREIDLLLAFVLAYSSLSDGCSKLQIASGNNRGPCRAAD